MVALNSLKGTLIADPFVFFFEFTDLLRDIIVDLLRNFVLSTGALLVNNPILKRLWCLFLGRIVKALRMWGFVVVYSATSLIRGYLAVVDKS